MHRCCKLMLVPLGEFVPHTDLWPRKRRQRLFSCHSKPYESLLPLAAFLVTAAPRVLAHAFLAWGGSLSTSRSLFFSTRLLQGLSSFVLSRGSNWLEANHRPGQRWAPARGHAHGCKPGAQLRTPVPPGCPIRSKSPLLAAPFPALARSPGQQELCLQRCCWLPGLSLSVGLSLQVCSRHTQHEASPKANP